MEVLTHLLEGDMRAYSRSRQRRWKIHRLAMPRCERLHNQTAQIARAKSLSLLLLGGAVSAQNKTEGWPVSWGKDVMRLCQLRDGSVSVDYLWSGHAPYESHTRGVGIALLHKAWEMFCDSGDIPSDIERE